MSRLVPLPCLWVGLDGGAGKREVGKTWEGGDPDEAFTTLSSGPRWVKHLLLSLGGALSSALIFPSLNSPATISCAGTMDGWVRSSSTEKLVLCNHSLQYFWETCRFLFRLSAVMTSLVDTRSRLGWDPWIVWPSRRSLWSLLGQQVPSTAIPGPAGLFKISFWTKGDTAFWGRCMAIWGYLYTSSGTAPLSGVLSSISLSPCLACSPARIVATGGLLRFQVVASIAPLTIEGHLWACRSLLSGWVLSHAESWVPRSLELSQ